MQFLKGKHENTGQDMTLEYVWRPSFDLQTYFYQEQHKNNRQASHWCIEGCHRLFVLMLYSPIGYV
jgi:hypothetical protein